MEKIEIFPVSEDYIKEAIEFNNVYNKLIEEIKNIFYNNLDCSEKKCFLNIINENDYYDDEYKDEDRDDDIQTIDNINEENIIKEYVSISMIKLKNEEKLYNVVLFIPTENDDIKKKIIEYIENNKFEGILQNIVFGKLNFYNIEEQDDE